MMPLYQRHDADYAITLVQVLKDSDFDMFGPGALLLCAPDLISYSKAVARYHFF